MIQAGFGHLPGLPDQPFFILVIQAEEPVLISETTFAAVLVVVSLIAR